MSGRIMSSSTRSGDWVRVLRIASRPGGSVVRAAASPIVNILGGGGLAPVIPEDVYQRLR